MVQNTDATVICASPISWDEALPRWLEHVVVKQYHELLRSISRETRGRMVPATAMAMQTRTRKQCTVKNRPSAVSNVSPSFLPS